MNFSQALEHIKKGRKVARNGWNGKNMYLLFIDSEWLYYQSVPEDECQFANFIGLKSVDGKIYPWLASQQDLFAEDWAVLKSEIS